MTRIHHTVRDTLLLAGLALAAGPGCDDDEGIILEFDAPIDVAIMEPNEILDVHAGFVSNFRSGKITKVDLKHASYLRDNPLGSWVRGMPLATGHNRLLEQIALAWRWDCNSFNTDGTCASEDYFVTLFASDADRSQLLVVPYLDTSVGIERPSHCLPDSGFIPRYPICIPELEGQSLREGTIPVQVPRADGDGDGTPDGWDDTAATVTGFWVREGHTTTETWAATWDAQREHFLVMGSRSGIQERTAVPGEAYFSDDNEVEFTVNLPEGESLAEGATFTFHTDNGIQEIDLFADLGLGQGAQVQDLRVFPQGCGGDIPCRLYASVQTGDGGGALLVAELSSLPGVLDPLEDITVYRTCPGDNPLDESTGEVDGEVCESRPMAMDVDDANGRLFIAEAAGAGGAYEVPVEDLEASRRIDAFGPTFDVAYVQDRTVEEGYQHLFAASLEPGIIHLYDLRADGLKDVNTFTPEIDPVRLYIPLTGLASSRVAVPIIEKNDEGVNLESILIGATTVSGGMQAIKGENGCLPFGTSAGAYVDPSLSSNNDQGADSNPGLIQDAETGRIGIVHPCGGIARSETWTFSYDEALGGYRVHGSLTDIPGEFQENIAYEDERYVTDRGELSVLIRAGTLPSTDGDTLVVPVLGNYGLLPAGELPADPALYTQSYGDRNDSWTAVKFRTVAVVVGTESDDLRKLDLAESHQFTPYGVMSYLQ